jgi:hypothetical protein
MPGEFYVETKGGQVNLEPIETSLADLHVKVDSIKDQTNKLAGETPEGGAVTADWQLAEANIVSIGAAGVRYKLHDLTVSIHNLVGTQVRVRLYKTVNGDERKVYDQAFDASIDTSGLPIINGSWAIHDVLRVTLQSNNPADNGKAVAYDFMLEAM